MSGVPKIEQQSMPEGSRDSRDALTMYQALVDAAGCTVTRVDRRGRRTFVNDAMAEHRGMTKAELLRGSFADTMLPQDRKKAWEYLRYCFEAGRPVTGFIAQHKIEGKRSFRQVSLVPIREPDGTIREVQTLSTDITELVEMRRQLELYSSMVRTAQEGERRRISQFLHDDTIQALLAVSHAIQAYLGEHRGPASLEILQQANAVVLDQIEALRRLSLTLRPAVLDHMGLDVAMRWMVRHACQGGDVQGVVEVSKGWKRLSPEVEIRLFRIAQEAVNNAVRHAQPRMVQVTLGIERGWLELVVADDGAGFKPPQSELELLRKGRMGLAGIRERALELGATLRVESRRNKGSRVVVRGAVRKMERSAPSEAIGTGSGHDPDAISREVSAGGTVVR